MTTDEYYTLCGRIFLQNEGMPADDMTDDEVLHNAVQLPGWADGMRRVAAEAVGHANDLLCGLRLAPTTSPTVVICRCRLNKHTPVMLMAGDFVHPGMDAPFYRTIVHHGGCVNCGRSKVVVTPTPTEKVTPLVTPSWETR